MAENTQGNMGSKGRSAADSARDIHNTAHNAAQNIREQVGEKVEAARSTIVDKSDDLLTKAGQGLTSVSETIRRSAPEQGRLGTAANTVADKLDQTGNYLRENGVEDVARSFESLVRRQPFAAIGAGFVIGILVGRMTTASRS